MSLYIEVNDINDELYENIFNLIKKNENIFITGSAGTGKTHVLKYIINNIQKHVPDMNKSNIIVSASTGLAASHLNGRTIYNVLNMSPHQPTKTIINNILKNDSLKKQWLNAKVLIIDEISLLSANFLDRINNVINELYKNLLPNKQDESSNNTSKKKKSNPFNNLCVIFSGDFAQLPPIDEGYSYQDINYAFYSDTWEDMCLNVIDLKKPYRHQDKRYFDLLERARFGEMEKDDHELLKTRIKKDMIENLQNEYTYLTGLKLDAIKMNNLLVDKLCSKGQKKYTYNIIYNNKNKRKNNGILPQILNLCIGARVHLVVNLDQKKGLVNGLSGIIKEFKFDDCNNEYYPIIKFCNGITTVIRRYTYTIDRNTTVRQLPLNLSWFFTIHKSQGMTLDKVCITLNTDNIFDCQQAYVALSRVRTIEDLYFIDYDENVFYTDINVKEFYKKLKQE